MTPHHLRAALSSIGWTQRGLAERLGVHPTTTRDWASGRREVPPGVAVWLTGLAAAHEAMARPVGWVDGAPGGNTRPNS